MVCVVHSEQYMLEVKDHWCVCVGIGGEGALVCMCGV